MRKTLCGMVTYDILDIATRSRKAGVIQNDTIDIDGVEIIRSRIAGNSSDKNRGAGEILHKIDGRNAPESKITRGARDVAENGKAE